MTTVIIPLYEGVTQLDFTGPHQMLSLAPGTRVVAASLGGKKIRANGLTFEDLEDLSGIDQCDVLLVPGGRGCLDAIENERFLAKIRQLAATASFPTSVCTGSLILAAAGILNGRRSACHWAWRHMLTAFGAIPDPGRIVRDGNILTGGGVTAGIDFSLALIAEIMGSDVAQTIQLQIEYAPQPPFDSGSPEVAPASIFKALKEHMEPQFALYEKRIEVAASRLRGQEQIGPAIVKI